MSWVLIRAIAYRFIKYFVLFTDYFRVIFAFASFYYMPSDPIKASVLYILSGLLDAIDGHMARLLNQGRKCNKRELYQFFCLFCG